jgi:hypothetical protein
MLHSSLTRNARLFAQRTYSLCLSNLTHTIAIHTLSLTFFHIRPTYSHSHLKNHTPPHSQIFPTPLLPTSPTPHHSITHHPSHPKNPRNQKRCQLSKPKASPSPVPDAMHKHLQSTRNAHIRIVCCKNAQVLTCSTKRNKGGTRCFGVVVLLW